MPEDSYSISDLASEFGISTRTIRFYEEKGLISPARQGQRRLYSRADRARIRLILRGKRVGMSLAEAAEFIDMYQPGHNNEQQLQALIDNVCARREKLLQQQQDLQHMLAGLDEVESLCRQAIASTTSTNAG